jgi:uncharacterized membrane protein YfcA
MARRRINWVKVLFIVSAALAAILLGSAAIAPHGEGSLLFGLVFLLVAYVNFIALRQHSAPDVDSEDDPAGDALPD